MVRALVLVAVLAVVLVPVAAGAQFVRWVDDQGNVHYVEGLDRVPERYRATAVPLGLRNSVPAAPAAKGAERRDAGATTIRFNPGERIMVDVRINGAASARLQLDTGADRTLISPRALAAAGVSFRHGPHGSIRGVTGEDRAQAVTVESLEVGEARVGPLAVIAYDMDASDSDGLLGRDFLDHFTVRIDPARGLVAITPK